MPNPLFNAFGNNPGKIIPPQFQGMMRQLQQFRANFQGDAEAQVRQLMKDGKMSQQQFDQFAQVANMVNGWL